MTIVPSGALKNDPQTLLYYYPSMHPVRYQKLIQEYTFWKHVETAEKVARMSGLRLVPRDCIHWARKKTFESKRIVIQRKVFYVLADADMTNTERSKYREALGGGRDRGEDQDAAGCS